MKTFSQMPQTVRRAIALSPGFLQRPFSGRSASSRTLEAFLPVLAEEREQLTGIIGLAGSTHGLPPG
jgi:hypothetical protein